MGPVKVLLADDHASVRAGIRRLLQRVPEVEVIGEASNGHEALRLARTRAPDVLLLDMEMPGMSGLQVARQLQADESSVCILAVSAYEDKHYILGMLENGAAGYLTKNEVPSTLIQAIKEIVRGEQGWVSPRVAAQIANWDRVETVDEYRLTAQQKRGLRLLANGKSENEIGLTLSTSLRETRALIEKAVKRIRAGLRRDLSLQTNPQGE